MPQAARPSPAAARYQNALIAAMRWVVAHLDAPISLEDLADAAGLPLNTLSRCFHRHYGTSPMRWLWRFRTAAAALAIREAPRQSLGSVAKACGFVSAGHFTRRFAAEQGLTPSSYRILARRGSAPLPTLDAWEQMALEALRESTAGYAAAVLGDRWSDIPASRQSIDTASRPKQAISQGTSSGT